MKPAHLNSMRASIKSIKHSTYKYDGKMTHSLLRSIVSNALSGPYHHFKSHVHTHSACDLGKFWIPLCTPLVLRSMHI